MKDAKATQVVKASGCRREIRKTPPRLKPTMSLGARVRVFELSN
jgi:hypothetical protein